jgi:hypothetical protein
LPHWQQNRTIAEIADFLCRDPASAAMQRYEVSKIDWPHTLAGAIAGEIIRWDSNGLGVNHTFPRADQQMHPLGTEDRMALRRLERAGKLTYVDDDVRDRYETAMTRARTWRSNTAGQRVNSIGCRRWRPNWSAGRSL